MSSLERTLFVWLWELGYFARLWFGLAVIYAAAALFFHRQFRRTQHRADRSHRRLFLGASLVMAVFAIFAASGLR
jgi:4-hydroxybenzoate polyprenyltransferase